MSGESNALSGQLTVTLSEEKVVQQVAVSKARRQPVDEAEREYLREKKLIEIMTARRLFADEDDM